VGSNGGGDGGGGGRKGKGDKFQFVQTETTKLRKNKLRGGTKKLHHKAWIMSLTSKKREGMYIQGEKTKNLVGNKGISRPARGEPLIGVRKPKGGSWRPAVKLREGEIGQRFHRWGKTDPGAKRDSRGKFWGKGFHCNQPSCGMFCWGGVNCPEGRFSVGQRALQQKSSLKDRHRRKEMAQMPTKPGVAFKKSSPRGDSILGRGEIRWEVPSNTLSRRQGDRTCGNICRRGPGRL